MHALRIALAASSIAALAGSALASIPGNIEQRAREGLLNVCIDNEPGDTDYIVCSAQEDDTQSPYLATECEAAGLPKVCTIDFIPKVKISGRLLLVNDDAALDLDSFPNPAGEAAIVLELKKGGKKATLVDLFDGTKIGNWNSFSEDILPAADIIYTNDDGTVFQFANDNLVDLGLEVRELATAWFPKADLSGAVAVLTVLTPDPKRPALDQVGAGNPLASAATFKVVIQFARVRP